MGQDTDVTICQHAQIKTLTLYVLALRPYSCQLRLAAAASRRHLPLHHKCPH